MIFSTVWLLNAEMEWTLRRAEVSLVCHLPLLIALMLVDGFALCVTGSLCVVDCLLVVVGLNFGGSRARGAPEKIGSHHDVILVLGPHRNSTHRITVHVYLWDVPTFGLWIQDRRPTGSTNAMEKSKEPNMPGRRSN